MSGSLEINTSLGSYLITPSAMTPARRHEVDSFSLPVITLFSDRAAVSALRRGWSKLGFDESDAQNLSASDLERKLRQSIDMQRLTVLAKTATAMRCDVSHQDVMNRIASKCRIVRRSEWRALPPAKKLESDWNYNSIVVHYTGRGTLDTMRELQDHGMKDEGWDDIAYHYCVFPDGKIFEGREIVFKGSHVDLQNTGKVGIVCVGDYEGGIVSRLYRGDSDGDPINSNMINSLKLLSQTLMSEFPIKMFGGHKEYGKTAKCPGEKLLPKVVSMRTELKLAMPVYKEV